MRHVVVVYCGQRGAITGHRLTDMHLMCRVNHGSYVALSCVTQLRATIVHRDMTEQEANKQAIRDLLLAVDSGDIEGALEFYSPNYVDHDASEARAATANPRDGLRQAFAMFAAAFSDTRHSIDDLVAEGDRVVARISVESRHCGDIFGLHATGATIRNDSIVIYRFEGGRIRERWCRERRTTRALLERARDLSTSP